jgi:hypothetical protein
MWWKGWMGLRFFIEMSNRVLKWRNTELAEILLAMKDTSMDAPKTYAVDTEFSSLRRGIARRHTASQGGSLR